MKSPSRRNLNILIVDDEEATVISVAYVLRHGGHAVDTAGDGRQALSLLKESAVRYHIVITDHAMPQVSGLELMAELRGAGFRGKTVILSGVLTRQLRESYTTLGADWIIAKPFEIAELRRAVEDLGAAVEY